MSLNNKKNRGILIIVGALIGVMVYNMLLRPGIKDLPGELTEISFSRNEQNTGPVMRVYVVTAERGNPEAMKQYGDYMPHTKYGTTRVFFFGAEGKYPGDLPAETIEVPEEFRSNCIAIYEKDGMSQVSFRMMK